MQKSINWVMSILAVIALSSIMLAGCNNTGAEAGTTGNVEKTDDGAAKREVNPETGDRG